jgi:hypothetical protein
MTPKEKAEQLFEDYYAIILGADSELSENITTSVLAKSSASRVANEIIKEIVEITDNEVKLMQVIYWEKVKEEILKL